MGRGSRVVSSPVFQQFPYRPEDRFKKSSGEVLDVLRPTIAVRLEYKNQNWTVRALIDSGAPFTLFDRGAGDALGVDYSSGDARRESFEIAGASRLALMAEVDLAVPTGKFDGLRWRVEVGFFYEDWGMTFGGLLGQNGFFDYWAVSFDYPHSFVVEAKESFISRLPSPISEEETQDLWEWQELGWRGRPPTRKGSRAR